MVSGGCDGGEWKGWRGWRVYAGLLAIVMGIVRVLGVGCIGKRYVRKRAM